MEIKKALVMEYKEFAGEKQQWKKFIANLLPQIFIPAGTSGLSLFRAVVLWYAHYVNPRKL